MASQKTQGNLRDFRIDRSLVNEFSTPKTTLYEETKKEKTPKQTIGLRGGEMRKSSVTEWDSTSEESQTNGYDAKSLWGEWKEDLSSEITEPKAKTPTKKSIEVPAETSEELTKNFGEAKAEDFAEISWVSELALEERKAERTGFVDFANGYQKQEILKKRTEEFTATLQRCFREHVELFNDSRKSPSHAIQIYRVSKTAEDFMLFRNGVKLIVSGQRSGRILFAFNQYLGQIFAPTQNPTLEIEADWGPFDQLLWAYKGERVQVLDVVRYFMTEFVHQSFK